MRCPIHTAEKLIKSVFQPWLGLDPKMSKYACQWCVEYWYKAPKGCLKRRWELPIPQLEFADYQSRHRRP